MFLIHPFIFTHIHTHTLMQAAMQGAGSTIGSNLGYSILPKDTLTCTQEELGIEPLTIYLPSHRSCNLRQSIQYDDTTFQTSQATRLIFSKGSSFSPNTPLLMLEYWLVIKKLTWVTVQFLAFDQDFSICICIYIYTLYMY